MCVFSIDIKTERRSHRNMQALLFELHLPHSQRALKIVLN